MIDKLKKLPLKTRKIIFWATVVTVSVAFGLMQFNFITKEINKVDFSSSPVIGMGEGFRSGTESVRNEFDGVEQSLEDLIKIIEEAEEFENEEN